MLNNVMLHESVKVSAPVDAATPDWVSAGDSNRLNIWLWVDNGTTVTAADVTLQQATDGAGTGAKAAPIDCVYQIDLATDEVTEVAIADGVDTFQTDTTDNADYLYAIQVDGACLDLVNSFSHVRVQLANQANTTITVQNAQYSLRNNRG